MSFCLPTTHPTPQHDDKIAQLHAEGLDELQIAKRLGIDPQTVRRALRRLGLVEDKPSAQLDEGLKQGNPIGCPDGTWCLHNADGPPLFWGSSEGAILSEVSRRVGSLDDAKRLMMGGARRWELLAAQAPALHRALTRKLKPTRPTPAPTSALPAAPSPMLATPWQASPTPAATPAVVPPTPSPAPSTVAAGALPAPRKAAEEAFARRQEASAARAAKLEQAAERIAERQRVEAAERERERLAREERARQRASAPSKPAAAPKPKPKPKPAAAPKKAAKPKPKPKKAGSRTKKPAPKRQAPKRPAAPAAQAPRKAAPALDAKTLEGWIKLAREGVSASKIAKMERCRASTVSAALRAAGVPRLKSGRTYKLTPAERQELAKRWSMGEEAADLARAYNVHVNTVLTTVRLIEGAGASAVADEVRDEIARQVVEGYEAGLSRLELASKHAISRPQVSRILIAAGYKTRDGARPTHDPAWDAQAVELYKGGMTSVQVAQQLGCDPQRVIRAVKRSGERVRRVAKEVDDATLLAAYSELGGILKVAQRYGMSSTTVGARLHAMGAAVKDTHAHAIADDQLDELARRYNAGETGPQLAAAYDVSYKALLKALVRAGIKPRRGSQGQEFSAEQIAAMRADLERGATITQVARNNRMGIDRLRKLLG